MQTGIIGTVFILSFIASSSGFGNTYWKIRNLVEKHRIEKIHKYNALLLKLSSNMDPGIVEAPVKVEEHYLTQPMDHFDSTQKKTYQQRYFIRKDSMKGPSSPVFLYIGGEGAISEGVLIAGEIVDLATKYGALMVAVEHRFYGASINDDGLKLDQLHFLSSQQGLADLAAFHLHASKTYNLTEKNTWICFGGSYPGALSAWFRIKYPHLVYGAIASSAPVHAQLNFEGYNDVVHDSLSATMVGGSKQCALNVREAFHLIDHMIENGQLDDLSHDLGSCQPVTKVDVYQFVSNLADIFMTAVQYNNEMPGYNIQQICQKMDAVGSPYTNLIEILKVTRSYMGINCTDNSWSGFVDAVSNTTVDRVTGGAGLRQWIYQTCAEFGYYQTCDRNTSCVFSNFQDLKSNLDLCKQVFGIPATEIAERVAFTNAYYGSNKPKGTRIVFVNGSIDPWHALSVLRNQSATETAIFIPGTAHCNDMEPSDPDDPSALQDARVKIRVQIGKWLQEAGAKKDTTLRFKPL